MGRVIIATCIPYETLVLETIRDMSLELQIIFNKGAVMVLPTGVNKASGLRAALLELGLSPHNAVGIGDAENDEAFLKLCDASAAVDNALETVKKQVDIVLRGAASAGVVELIEQLIAADLQALHDRPDRGILLGKEIVGGDVRIPVYGTRVLVTGDSAGGKSKLAIGMLEQLIDAEYQTLVIDPEGDYQSVKGPIGLARWSGADCRRGNASRSPIGQELRRQPVRGQDGRAAATVQQTVSCAAGSSRPHRPAALDYRRRGPLSDFRLVEADRRTSPGGFSQRHVCHCVSGTNAAQPLNRH